MNTVKCFILACMLFVMFGCGKGTPGVQDPSTKQYVQYFERFSGHSAALVNVNIVDVIPDGQNEPGVVGLCDHNNATVSLLRTFWENVDAGYKRNLVMHELGHCVLGYVHNDTYVNGCPTTYMSSYLISDTCWDSIEGKDMFSDMVTVNHNMQPNSYMCGE